jgi:hypothetical protein
MAYTNQTVEEILVLARHGALEKSQKNRAIVEALGPDILGSLDDDEQCEAFLDYARDLRRKRKGIREIEVALTLRRLDDEALAMADFVDRCGCQRLGSDHREEPPR